METGIKIENKHFIVPFERDSGEICVSAVALPTRDEFASVSGFLSSLFLKIQNGEINLTIFQKDYKFILNEILSEKKNGARIFKEIEALIDRRVSFEKCFNASGEAIFENEKEMSDDEKDSICAGLLFFSCLFRYAKAQFSKADTQHLIASVPQSELGEFIKKLFADFEEKRKQLS